MASRTVLIVDDERMTRELVRLALVRAGYDVIEAEDGVRAIQEMESGSHAGKIEALITDLSMPTLDGFDMIEYIRAKYPSIPVLVLTGKVDMAVALDLLRRGVHEYLLKPVDPRVLVMTVDRVMGKRADHHTVIRMLNSWRVPYDMSLNGQGRVPHMQEAPRVAG